MRIDPQPPPVTETLTEAHAKYGNKIEAVIMDHSNWNRLMKEWIERFPSVARYQGQDECEFMGMSILRSKKFVGIHIFGSDLR